MKLLVSAEHAAKLSRTNTLSNCPGQTRCQTVPDEHAVKLSRTNTLSNCPGRTCFQTVPDEHAVKLSRTNTLSNCPGRTRCQTVPDEHAANCQTVPDKLLNLRNQNARNKFTPKNTVAQRPHDDKFTNYNKYKSWVRCLGFVEPKIRNDATVCLWKHAHDGAQVEEI